MKRLHLFEFIDQSWCPEFIRLAITDFLLTVARLTKLWHPTAKVLQDILRKTSEKRLIILGAGSGGGIIDAVSYLPDDIEITLTDLYPNKEFKSSDPRIKYHEKPVDATNVPAALCGVRIMYAMFHHLPPESAKKVLRNAVNNGQAIAIFEGTERSIPKIFGMFLVPFIVLLITPVIRPFRWSRLFMTYLVPLLPMIIFWDGFVSALRSYDIDDMKNFTDDLPGYEWNTEILKGPHGESIPTLTGFLKR
jgi:hypothetical protein